MTAPDSRAAAVPRTGSVGEAWLAVTDDVLGSINHALSNRLAALISLVRVMEYGGSENEALFPVLQREVERLERTTSLLRLLPRDREEQAEPIRWSDLVPDVLALLDLQRDARELPIEVHAATDAIPAWAPRIGVTHALLMALHTASRLGLQAASHGLRIGYADDGDWAALTVAILAPAERAARPPAHAGVVAEFDAPAAVMRQASGELVCSCEAAGDTWLRLELRLPTLLAVRRHGTRPGSAVPRPDGATA